MARAALACCWALALAAAPATAQEEFRFDVSQFEKKSYELNGYVELRGEHFVLDRDAALYQLNNFDQAPRSRLTRGTGSIELSGLYRQGIATVQATAHAEAAHDSLDTERSFQWYEAYLTLQPGTGARIEAGKRALRWGKGYAFNPVGFVERLKDPNDPELSREGYVLLAGNFIHSFDGPLKTLAFTPLLLPTRDHLNSDFGPGKHLNPAAKLSLLYYDTDIDFLWQGKGARGARYGFDFARNFGSNLALHGEWARSHDVTQPVLSASGVRTQQTRNSTTSYLLGLRYITERETTWIAEYYRNGIGYTEQQLRDYFSFVHDAYDQYLASNDATQLERTRAFGNSYARANPAQRYFYLRASQKEPFDILYFTPSVTLIQNLDDGSRSLSPELLYTGITDLELRLRLFLVSGERLSDFGEKQNDRRAELRLRYSF